MIHYNLLIDHLYDINDLLYPNVCLSCYQTLSKGEDVLCLSCLYKLPVTNFHNEPNNNMEKKFWGRINIERAAAFLYFKKGGMTQNLIHRLKYEQQKLIGIKIGQLYGSVLKEADGFKDTQLIVPVPLHSFKEHQRGYNQSAVFAEGLSKTMDASWSKNALIRTVYNPSQTRKSKYERWTNVDSIFQLNDKEMLKGKNVLLVDDVITTGSTLESCASVLSSVPGIKISIATIAIAS